MTQAPAPVGIRHLLGEHLQYLLAQLSQPHTYPEELSALRHLPCEPAGGRYLRFFDMLRLEPTPEEAPSPSPENVAYTLETINRAVAPLLATTGESRVSLLDLVEEM